MKNVCLTLSITSILIMLLQTYSVSGIYAINEESNATMDIDKSNLPEESAFISVVGNVSNPKFNDIILEGKSTLLNVLDIKPNAPIKYNIITCLAGKIYSDINGGGPIGDISEKFVNEVNCNNIGVIEDGGYSNVNTTYRHNTPAVSSSLLTAVSQGIEKPITTCYFHAQQGAPGNAPLPEEMDRIQIVDCDLLYILYK